MAVLPEPITDSAHLLTDDKVTVIARAATLDYLPGFAYSVGMPCVYGSTFYFSLQNANTGNQPDTSPAWWMSISTPLVPKTYIHVFKTVASGGGGLLDGFPEAWGDITVTDSNNHFTISPTLDSLVTSQLPTSTYTYYVNPSDGSDLSTTGDISHPFKTIAKAMVGVHGTTSPVMMGPDAGDVIHLQAGVHYNFTNAYDHDVKFIGDAGAIIAPGFTGYSRLIYPAEATGWQNTSGYYHCPNATAKFVWGVFDCTVTGADGYSYRRYTQITSKGIYSSCVDAVDNTLYSWYADNTATGTMYVNTGGVGDAYNPGGNTTFGKNLVFCFPSSTPSFNGYGTGTGIVLSWTAGYGTTYSTKIAVTALGLSFVAGVPSTAIDGLTACTSLANLQATANGWWINNFSTTLYTTDADKVVTATLLTMYSKVASVGEVNAATTGDPRWFVEPTTATIYISNGHAVAPGVTMIFCHWGSGVGCSLSSTGKTANRTWYNENIVYLGGLSLTTKGGAYSGSDADIVANRYQITYFAKNCWYLDAPDSNGFSSIGLCNVYLQGCTSTGNFNDAFNHHGDVYTYVNDSSPHHQTWGNGWSPHVIQVNCLGGNSSTANVYDTVSNFDTFHEYARALLLGDNGGQTQGRVFHHIWSSKVVHIGCNSKGSYDDLKNSSVIALNEASADYVLGNIYGQELAGTTPVNATGYYYKCTVNGASKYGMMPLNGSMMHLNSMAIVGGTPPTGYLTTSSHVNNPDGFDQTWAPS